MATSLALISAVVDGDRDALAQAVAIADRSLGEALTAPDPDVSRAAADATVAVLAVHDLLSGVLPPAAADAAWPLPALLELLPAISQGVARLAVPDHRVSDRHEAVAHLRRAHDVLGELLA